MNVRKPWNLRYLDDYSQAIGPVVSLKFFGSPGNFHLLIVC